MLDGVYNRREIEEMFETGEIKSLDDIYMIEDVALIIKDLNHKIEMQKEYKRKRIEAIKNEITVLENKVNFYKKIICKTFQDNKETKITFPDSCKVSIRKVSPNWIIDDEDDFIDFIKQMDVEEETKELEVVAKKIEEYKIIKKEANKLLNILEKRDKLTDISCVHKSPGEPSVTIKYDNKEIVDIDIDVPIPIKEQNFDELEM